MIGVIGAFGLWLTGVLLLVPRRGPWAHGVKTSRGWGRVVARLRRDRWSVSPAANFHDASLMVAQLAALVRSGRTPDQLWEHAQASSAPAFSAVLGAASRAAALGAPVAPAIRSAGASDPAARRSGTGVAAGEHGMMWREVAACIEASESSGCPLAGVFDRLAAQLEADADAAAARKTALAGPKATTQILSVLPLIGLVLGTLIGADPISVLLGTPIGILCLALGAGLTAAGRIWSSRLVMAAAVLR